MLTVNPYYFSHSFSLTLISISAKCLQMDDNYHIYTTINLHSVGLLYYVCMYGCVCVCVCVFVGVCVYVYNNFAKLIFNCVSY